MQQKRVNKLIVMLLALMLVLSNFASVFATGEDSSGANEKKFVLVAMNEDGYVIEPEYITYEENQSIKNALVASSHTFTGIEQNFIQKIDGSDFSGTYFYDGGAYDLNALATTVQKGIVFTWQFEGVYSEDYLDLVVKLAEYPNLDAEAKSFAPLKTAYKDAKDELPAANSAKAKELLDAITAAEAEYEAWKAQQPCAVTFVVKKGENAVSDAVISIKEAGGGEYTANGNSVQLRNGNYTFSVDKGGDQVTGSFQITAEDTEKTINANLPDSDWFGTFEIGGASGNNWYALPMETSDDGLTITVKVPDSVIHIYPNIAPSQANDAAWKSSHRWYADYTDTTDKYWGDESTAGNARAWASKSSSVTRITANGLEGRTDVRFKVVYKDEQGYVQRQFKNIIIDRTPTLKGLVVSEPSGTVLALDPAFKDTQKSYNVTTVSNELVISGNTRPANNGYGYYSEGYGITVNNNQQPENGTVTVPVDNGTSISVVATSESGETNEYTVNVSVVDKSTVKLQKENSSVSTHLVTGTDSVILPTSTTDTEDTFEVAPGDYTWVGTIEDYYHTKGTIAVDSAGASANVPTPRKEKLLKDLYGKPGTSTKALVFEEANGKEFNWEDHEYTYVVFDNTSSFNIFFDVENIIVTKKGSFWRGAYTRQSDRAKQAALEKKVTSASAGKSNLVAGNFTRTGEENNSFIASVQYVENDVTYYQEYFISTNRHPLLQDISLATVNGNTVTPAGITQKTEGESGFDYLINEYTASIPKGATQLRLSYNYSLIQNASKGDYVIKVGSDEKGWTSLPRAMEAKTEEVTVTLDPSKDTENISVVLDTGDPDNVINIYNIELTKTPPVIVTFNVTPEDHNLVVMDNTLKEVIPQIEPGKYELMKGGSYTYTATAHGYVGQKQEFSPEDSETITVSLEKAQENPNIRTDMDAHWPRFRFDQNNNGATNYPTPVEAEKTTLYWANKVGSGYGSGATGCPIIIDDYIYTYAGTSILKINKFTGQVEATGTMVGSSSFAINSPTYAEGMIFVALSGKVQAFNAETLESLWVYTDPIGGQPNCPIAYHDGYIYTGFWKSETAQANFVCLSVTDEDPLNLTEEKIATWTVKDNGFYWAGAYVGPGASGGDKTYIIVGTDDGDGQYINESGNLLSIDRKTGLVIDKIDGVCLGDIRSSIAYSDGRYYFTSKGGYFCSIMVNDDGTFNRASLKKLYLFNSSVQPGGTVPMSTSTPCIYNGRAYVGVSGSGQFSAYSGHNITVIDLNTFKIAYSVPTKGYPQTSGLLTTAYSEKDGSAYVYFLDNYTPGMLRVIKDKQGQTKPEYVTQENGMDAAYVLFTPFGSQGQYAICSPISDTDGFMYFKNDSAFMMMVGPTIESIDVEKAPNKTSYEIGETFDATGMVVTATFSNGVTKDITKYISYRETPFTSEEMGIQPVDIQYQLGDNMLMYHDVNGVAGQEYIPPTGTVNVTVKSNDRFTVSIDGNELDSSKIVLSDTPYDASYKDWTTEERVESLIPLYVVSIPTCDINEAEITFSSYKDSYCTYYYTREADSTGYTKFIEDTRFGTYDAERQMYVAAPDIAYTAAINSKNVIRVQTEYDASWQSDNLYAIAFDYEKDHNIESVPEKAAKCEEEGEKAHWKCTVCGKLFADENGTEEASADSLKIEATGHSWDEGEVTTAPTATENGVKTFKCIHDSEHTKTEVVPAYGEEKIKINLLGQVEKNTLKKVLFDFEVSSEDAAKYGYTKPEAFLGKVTMSDAAAALHREIYGDEFEANPTKYLKISSAGTCTLIFGEPTYMNGFRLNDITPEYPEQPGTGSLWNDTPLKDGDNVRIFQVYGENYGLLESYLIFDEVEYSAHEGGSIDITVTGDLTFGTMMGMPADVQPAEGAVVYAVTDFTDPEGTKFSEAITDEEGVASFINLPVGEYHLVVYEYENDYLDDCFSTPYANLTVTEHTWDEGKVTIEPTCSEEGEKTFKCTFDGCEHTKTESIPKVDPKPLTDAIKAAKNAEAGVATSKDGSDVDPSKKWTTAAEKKALDDAIAAAQKVADNKASTQKDVDDAVKAVKDAKASYEKAKKDGKKKEVAPQIWQRLYGNGRYDTMKAIVDEGFTKTGGTVVMVTGANYKDALSASGLAGLHKAPIVTTDGKSLSKQANQILNRLKPKTVIVIGGTSAITDKVLSQIERSTGVKPKRVSGKDSCDTSAKAAVALKGKWKDNTAIIATNASYKDALSVAPISYAKGYPILLANGGKTLTKPVLDALKTIGTKHVIIVGGEGAVSKDVEKQLKKAGIKIKVRLAGKTAVDTSAVIARWGLKNGMTVNKMGVASSQNYPDALAGAALCGINKSVLVLADDKAMANAAFPKDYKGRIKKAYVFGGEVAVGKKTWDALNQNTK